MKIGDKVKFKPIQDCPELCNQTGVIEADQFGDWIVRLDNQIPGFYSGTAWAFPDELEVIASEFQ